MDTWFLLTNLFSQLRGNALLTGISANAAWGMIKGVAEGSKDGSLEYLSYRVLAETFEQFYQKKGFEFDEGIVMEAFFEQIKDRNIISAAVSKTVIEKTINTELTAKDFEAFERTFKDTCAKPEYTPVFKRVLLEQVPMIPEERNLDWMQDYMKDNYCEIDFKVVDSITPDLLIALNQIKASLDKSIWYSITGLIWEVAYNAYRHGNATLCRLNINADSISISDNGKVYNCLSLIDQKVTGGGGMAIKQFVKDNPNIGLHYAYEGQNTLSICFGKPIFDINYMSEIVFSAPSFQCCLERLYPEGQFKYYFIDFANSINKQALMILMTFSGSHRVYTELFDLLQDSITEKIFLYFSDTKSEEMIHAYNVFKSVISYCPELKSNSIVFIPDTL